MGKKATAPFVVPNQGPGGVDYDWRLGERVASPRFLWTTEVPVPRAVFGTRLVQVEGIALDVSMTGARLWSERPPSVPLGKVLDTRCGEASGRIRVRHVEERAGGVHWGVQFVELDPDLAELVGEIVGGERVSWDWRWTTAW